MRRYQLARRAPHGVRKQTLDITDAVFERALPLRLGIIHPCLACGTSKGRVSEASGPPKWALRLYQLNSEHRGSALVRELTLPEPRSGPPPLMLWTILMGAALSLAASAAASVPARSEQSGVRGVCASPPQRGVGSAREGVQSLPSLRWPSP